MSTLIVDEEESDDDAGAEIELGSDDRLVFFKRYLAWPQHKHELTPNFVTLSDVDDEDDDDDDGDGGDDDNDG